MQLAAVRRIPNGGLPRLIGEKVMAQLRDWDDVAYVRFASVYRHFSDITDFMDELKRLLETKTAPESDQS